MITLLIGTNTYAARAFLDEIGKKYDFHGISRKEGSEIEVDSLPELLHGASLFAEKRLVVIHEASSNKNLWIELANWLEKVPDEIHLVFIETAPDKRTKTFKLLQKKAAVKEVKALNEHEAANWLVQYAKKQTEEITQKEAAYLVDKIGTDEWRLSHELQKLLLVNDTSQERIDNVVEATPQSNVFALIDAALQGRKDTISRQIIILETQEEPYRVFGLLASQVFQLATLQSAKDIPIDQIAKDISTHPYPLKKLKPLANSLSKRDVMKIVDTVATLDSQLKRSAGDPWLLLERALVKIASD